MTLLSIIALLAIVFGVATRLYWGLARGTTHDSWYHLYLADRIRREHRLPGRVDQFLISGPYDYPPILHILLAALPAALVFRYKWLFAPLVDAVHLLLLGGVTYWLTGDVTTTLIAMSIYATYTTQIVQFTALTPRVLGALLVSIIVLLAFFGVQTGMGLPLGVAVILGVVLLHTHKMSSQTVLFLFLFLAVVWMQPIYLGLLAAMTVLAVILSGGHYLTILRGHINIINFWRRQHRAGRPVGEFMRRYGVQPSGDGRGPDSMVTRLLAWVERNEWVMFVADNAWTFLLVAILAYGAVAGLDLFVRLPTFARMIAVWALFILGLAILTQYVPYLKLVGDGYKYFMWGAFPTAVVLAMVLPVQSDVVAAVYVISLIGTATYGFTRIHLRVNEHRSGSRDITVDGRKVLEFLEGAAGENVLLLPFGMSFHVLYQTDLNVLFHQNPKIEAEAAFPVPIEPLEDIVTDFHIDYVVVDTTKVDLDAFETGPFRIVFEDSEYVVMTLGQ